MFKRIIIAIFLSAAPASAQQIIYVDDDAAPGGDGTSWSSAYRYLQDAVYAANADPDHTEIRVAGGVYTPDIDEAGEAVPGDPLSLFDLRASFTMVGGFAGLQDAVDPDRRDLTSFETVLSGDLGEPGVDASDAASILESRAFTEDFFAGLDGLSFARASQLIRSDAVVLLEFSEAIVIDCRFYSNLVSGSGSSLLTLRGEFGGSPTATVSGCTFSGNLATDDQPTMVRYSNTGLIMSDTSLDGRGAPGFAGIESEPFSSTNLPLHFNDVAFLSLSRRALSTSRSSVIVRNCLFDSIQGRTISASPQAGTEDAVLLEDTIIQNGFTDSGRLISINSSFSGRSTFRRVQITDNTLSWTGEGNAPVAISGADLIDDCEISGNEAPSTLVGAGTIRSSQVIDNSSGGFVLDAQEIDNCTIENNSGVDGVCLTAVARNSTFTRNFAFSGGGAITSDSPFFNPEIYVANCRFVANVSGSSGGAIFATRSLTAVNSVFIGNFALGSGGAVAIDPLTDPRDDHRIVNCTFLDNDASAEPRAVDLSTGDAQMFNSIVWDTQAGPGPGFGPVRASTLRHCIVRRWAPGQSPAIAVSGMDPQLVDLFGPDGLPGTGDEDVRLQSSSPALDAGRARPLLPADALDLDNDGDVFELLPVDAAGMPRVLTVGIACEPDLGAFESGEACADECVADLNTTNANPGEPGWGEPDGQTDGSDLSYFVEQWLEGSALADLNTSNVNPPDPRYGFPDGTVDGADLSFYVEAWLAGCP